ncbi:hypothetical protein VSR34_01205 [Paraburkholderia sp. JHI2823]|uniref:hypothetical protein n=1 Tax=Paraburkholderia sp. JHI2823 TaxID=3112960 RepID=UPI0031820DE9
MSYSLDYRDFLIDHTPFEVDAGVFGAQWTIWKCDARSGGVPYSSGDLGLRGTAESMAEVGKRQALDWIDHNTRDSVNAEARFADVSSQAEHQHSIAVI